MSDRDPMDKEPGLARYQAAMRELAEQARLAEQQLPPPNLDGIPTEPRGPARPARGIGRRPARVVIPVLAAAAVMAFTGTLVLRSALPADLPGGQVPDHLHLVVEGIYRSSDYVGGSIALATGAYLPGEGTGADGSPDTYLDSIWDSVIGGLGAN